MSKLSLEEKWVIENRLVRNMARWVMGIFIVAESLGWFLYRYNASTDTPMHPLVVVAAVMSAIIGIVIAVWLLVAEYEVASDEGFAEAIKAKDDPPKRTICDVCAIPIEKKEYATGSWKN